MRKRVEAATERERERKERVRERESLTGSEVSGEDHTLLSILLPALLYSHVISAASS